MPVAHGSYIRDIPMMHKYDCKVGLDENIAPFGACDSPENEGKKIIIHDATNVKPIPNGDSHEYVAPPMPIEGRLCIPELANKWFDACENTLVDGNPALTTNCSITCKYGGTIFFISDGQGVE
jgi:hypothetical protein